MQTEQYMKMLSLADLLKDQALSTGYIYYRHTHAGFNHTEHYMLKSEI